MRGVVAARHDYERDCPLPVGSASVGSCWVAGQWSWKLSKLSGFARLILTLNYAVPAARSMQHPPFFNHCPGRRTPETRARLAARSCNAVLSRATLDLLEVALGSLRGAAAAFQQARAGGASAEAGALSAPQLANHGAIWNFQMPRLLT